VATKPAPAVRYQLDARMFDTDDDDLSAFPPDLPQGIPYILRSGVFGMPSFLHTSNRSTPTLHYHSKLIDHTLRYEYSYRSGTLSSLDDHIPRYPSVIICCLRKNRTKETHF